VSDITMIGLGAMGSALAHAFAGAGHDLVVWNRTMARTAPLVEKGATAAQLLADAVGASPVVAVCIDNYGAMRKPPLARSSPCFAASAAIFAIWAKIPPPLRPWTWRC
jgi:3-hydroxyisobutyrate dehydrogenase-like beta-hydroxyacid dehydrogenase